jgi:hypothetical protein
MMPALSIRAPWAWLIIHGRKNIENRRWTTGYRGRFLVHATGTNLKSEYESALRIAQKFTVEMPPIDELPLGCIIGSVSLEGIQKPRDVEEWGDPGLCSQFYGWGDSASNFWWHLARPVPHTPEPCPGRLGWFFP